MNKIILHTIIDAPIERCFDLSRSIDLHKISASRSKEQAIDGITEGLIELNDTVTWKAKHFGFWHQMKVKITKYDRPNHFTDEMERGTFKFMKHKHEFTSEGDSTRMTDTFEYSSPLGILGTIVDNLIMKKYMTQFLIERNQIIKDFAETDKWKLIPEVNEM